MAFKPDKNIAKALKQSNDIKNNSTENKNNISKIDYSERRRVKWLCQLLLIQMSKRVFKN